MGNIGSGSGTSYPTTLDTQTSVEVDAPNANQTICRAAVPNDLAAALIAVETALGTNPQGADADVKTFLQSEHGTNGAHGAITATNATFTTPTVTTPTASNPTISGTIGGTPVATLGDGSTATTQAVADNTTKLATTAFVGQADKLGQASIVADDDFGASDGSTILAGTAIAANRLVAGQVIRIILEGTCTSPETNAITFTVHLGTIGSGADGAIVTGSVTPAGSGTSIPFHLEILVTIRTVGASATCVGNMIVINNGNTGINSTGRTVVVMTPSTFDTTVADQKISVKMAKTFSSSNAVTVNQAVIEFVHL